MCKSTYTAYLRREDENEKNGKNPRRMDSPNRMKPAGERLVGSIRPSAAHSVIHRIKATSINSRTPSRRSISPTFEREKETNRDRDILSAPADGIAHTSSDFLEPRTLIFFTRALEGGGGGIDSHK